MAAKENNSTNTLEKTRNFSLIGGLVSAVFVPELFIPALAVAAGAEGGIKAKEWWEHRKSKPVEMKQKTWYAMPKAA